VVLFWYYSALIKETLFCYLLAYYKLLDFYAPYQGEIHFLQNHEALFKAQFYKDKL